MGALKCGPGYDLLQISLPKGQTINNMVFYPTIGRQYFVKTQTYVALFGPPPTLQCDIHRILAFVE